LISTLVVDPVSITTLNT